MIYNHVYVIYTKVAFHIYNKLWYTLALLHITTLTFNSLTKETRQSVELEICSVNHLQEYSVCQSIRNLIFLEAEKLSKSLMTYRSWSHLFFFFSPVLLKFVIYNQPLNIKFIALESSFSITVSKRSYLSNDPYG